MQYIAGAGGFLAGAAGGIAGSAFATPIQSIGNSMYFGDPMITGKQYFASVAIGGLIGGVINGSVALWNGRSFWDGTLTTLPESPVYVPSSIQNNKSEIQLLKDEKPLTTQISEEYTYTVETTTRETPFSIEGQSIRLSVPRPEITGYNNSIANKTDLFHEFPYQFDKIIVQEGVFSYTSESNYWYIAPGTINSSNGWYSIGMYPNGVIFHRCFSTYYPIAH